MLWQKKEDKSFILFTAFHKEGVLPAIPYLRPIHAGRALAKALPAMEGDDEGDSISLFNAGFSELTAMYNIWKTKKYLPLQYWGICHYRRFFTVNPKWQNLQT